MFPWSNHSVRSSSCERLCASAFARQMPLIPPADVPAITSTTTRVCTPSSFPASSPKSRAYTCSVRVPDFWSAPEASSAEPFTSRFSSFVTPCM